MLGRIATLLRMKPPVTSNTGLLIVSGLTVPSDADAGFQTGCIFQKTDGGVGTSLWINEGSNTSCLFNAVEPLESITLGDLADVADAYATRILETGTYQSTASGGLTISSTNTRPFTILSDDAGVATTGDIRVFLSRNLMTIDKASGTINAIRGQVKMLDGVDTTAVTVVASAITGYLELTGTGARSFAGRVAAIQATVEEGASGATTIAANSWYSGIAVTLNSSRTYVQTGLMAGIIVNHGGGTSTWPVGIVVDLGTGISATAELSSTGMKIILPQSTNVAASPDLLGLSIAASGAMTAGTSGDPTFTGISITTPACVCTLDTIVSTGLKIVIGAITQSGGTMTSNGILITGGTINSGTSHGVSLAGIFTNAITLTQATNLVKLPGSGTNPVASGGTIGTHGTATLKIKIDIGGAVYYLLASTTPTFT